jgi:hypothetical protein
MAYKNNIRCNQFFNLKIIIYLNVKKVLIIHYENIPWMNESMIRWFTRNHFKEWLKNQNWPNNIHGPFLFNGFHFIYHKFNGSRFGNNRHVKFAFHRFVWNGHGCHSFIYVVWTSMLCTLFKHECHMPICII